MTEPLRMAGLLAYKAFKGSGAQTPAAPEQGAPRGGTVGSSGGGLGDILGGLFGGRSGTPAQPSGSLNDLLRGGLGGLLGGAAAGSVLSGGLGNLIRDLQSSGHGDVADSWVQPGPNRQIAPSDLEHALGGDTLKTLSRQTGMDRDDLLEGLSQHLPEFVDQLTPQGRLRTDDEASRMVWRRSIPNGSKTKHPEWFEAEGGGDSVSCPHHGQLVCSPKNHGAS